MNFSSLLELGYYFDPFVSLTFPGFWYVLAGAGLLLVVTIIFHLWMQSTELPHPKTILFSFLLKFGYGVSLPLLAWLFFRYQSINYFNMRIWPAITLLVGVIILGLMFKYWWLDMPELEAERKVQEAKDYYLKGD